MTTLPDSPRPRRGEDVCVHRDFTFIWEKSYTVFAKTESCFRRFFSFAAGNLKHGLFEKIQTFFILVEKLQRIRSSTAYV